MFGYHCIINCVIVRFEYRIQMNMLINASNLNAGGGLQVADSICCQLYKHPEHEFVVVASSSLKSTIQRMGKTKNVKTYVYDTSSHFLSLLSGRDRFLDDLVEKYNIDAVLTVFGPSMWEPKCAHLAGFAAGQMIFRDSPYYKRGIPLKTKFREFYRLGLKKFLLKKGTNSLYSENSNVSKRLESMFIGKKVYTVTNYYNQVFDELEKWEDLEYPKFNGTTLLTVTSAYPHKNLNISIDISEILIKKHPDFQFRFVFTINESEFPILQEHLKEHFFFTGKIDISQCPKAYQQSDIMFQPTLMECFTATYPEAMKMGLPIITTDLDFAHGLCGDAALYYSPLSAEDAAEKIYYVATNEEVRSQLIEKGYQQLLQYDNYEERTNKLLKILEELVNESK